jgi:two-component system chemotaxis response regulator CheB
LGGKLSARVVVVSISDRDSALALTALQAGAFEIVHKPTASAVSQLYEIGNELVEVVRAAALSTAPRATVAPTAPRKQMMPSTARELLVIGASTGGPHALTCLLSLLPANFPVPVAIVLHIPQGYTAALAKRLDQRCALEVVEAEEGVVLQTGRVVIARAGHHLKLTRQDSLILCKFDLLPLESRHRPAIDVLFRSAAEVVGAGTLGVVLTGMGDDGLLGAQAIRGVGGTVLTEAASSCVIYGMPRAVMEAGLSAAEAPIERMAEEISRFL